MNTKDIGYIALSTALLTLSAWIAIPIGGVPITLQSLILVTIVGLLGIKRTFVTLAAYLILGCIGVPVFAGFTGGLTKFLTPTGGYIIGFFPFALCTGIPYRKTERKNPQTRTSKFLFAFLGLAICYILGTAWFIAVTLQNGGTLGLWTVLLACVLPYLPLDIVKLIIAIFLIEKLQPILKTNHTGMR